MLSCQAGLTNCSGVCVNQQTDNNNCGTCAHACPSGTVCSGATCVASCPPGQTNCSGTCTNTAYDPNHCGNCGTVCGAGKYCDAGVCTTV